MARIREVRSQLKRDDRTGIELYAAIRNSGAELREGRGVTSQAVIDNYFDAIEWARDTLSRPPFELAPPEKIHATVLDIGEILSTSQPFVDHRLHIYLPSRTREKTSTEELGWMRSAAIHETTHVVCLSQPGFPAPRDSWHPFVEGTAVYLQTLDAATAPNTMPLFLTWCDHPERPLPKAPYTAGLFTHYLTYRFQPTIIRDLWKSGAGNEDPWAVLSGLTTPQYEFLFADYCLSAFFPYDDFTAKIRDRYGQRHFTAVRRIKPGTSERFPSTLDRFACRYYSIEFDSASSLTVDCSTPEWAELVLDAMVLSPQPGTPARLGRPGPRSAALAVSGGDTVLLTVSNDRRKTDYSFAVQVS